MYLVSLEDAETLKNVLDECHGSVWLQSETDYFNMKSALSQYVGIAKLFDRNNNLEMFASSKDDEARLIRMLNVNPGIVA